MSFKMKKLMGKLRRIGEYSLPLCKHKDESIAEAAQEINKLARQTYKELEKSNFKEKEADPKEPIVRFL